VSWPNVIYYINSLDGNLLSLIDCVLWNCSISQVIPIITLYIVLRGTKELRIWGFQNWLH